jgi:hypothetical protein
MPSPFLLDTNAYFLLFQHPAPTGLFELLKKIKQAQETSFYISEITSMEIHSVLGKYRRGVQVQEQPCGREIVISVNNAKCTNVWRTVGRRQLSFKVFKGLQKMVSDIENQRGDIKATILPLNPLSIRTAQKLLINNADRFAFGSHDALIAASAIVAKQSTIPELTLVTSDKGLKAVLKEQAFPFYDPLKS